MPAKQTKTLIVGASIAGLASAAALQRQGVDYIIIEKNAQIATPWRNHYHRLHLHTSKRFSNLPYKKFTGPVPRYPSRQQVVDYLEAYQREFAIEPFFNTEALSIRRVDDHWHTETNNRIFRSEYLIMATGAYSKPRPIDFNGVETFPGSILHSCKYKTGRSFKGQKVLVVGFGNSACEIAIDLYEQGALPSMSVRSPVNIVPRDVFGMSVLGLSILLSRLPPRVADTLTAPLMKWLIGDITKLGLKRMPYGPLEEISRDGIPPVLDIGTIRHIRQGNIKVYDDIDHIEGSNVYFKGGKSQSFDAIVAAIGYYRDYAEILQVDGSRFEDLRVDANRQRYFGNDGLYFCGYWISPTGQIRSIAADAKKIAKDIAARSFPSKA